MVLQQCGFAFPERGGDRDAFVFGEDDAFEGGVKRDVVVEGARVLSNGVEVAAEGAEGAAVDAVGVGDAVYFWSGGVDGVVDHVGWRFLAFYLNGSG